MRSGASMFAEIAMNQDSSKHLTLAAMSLGYGVVQLDVAVNSIGQSFGGGGAGLQWVVPAHTTAFAALILSAGALGDRIGAKPVFAAALQSSPPHPWPVHWRHR